MFIKIKILLKNIFHRYKILQLIRDGAPSRIMPNWEIAYSPQNKLIDEIVNSTAMNMTNEEITISLKAFPNSEMLSHYISNSSPFAAVQFSDEYANLTEYPIKFAFDIRLPSVMRIRERGHYNKNMETWMTDKFYSETTKLSDGDQSGFFQANYIGEGFAAIQLGISMNYIRLATNLSSYPSDCLRLSNFSFYRYSLQERKEDTNFPLKMNIVSAMFFFMNFIVFLYFTSILSSERKKMKHLEIAGFSLNLQVLSWIITMFLCYAIMNIILCIAMKMRLGNRYPGILSKVTWDLFLTYLMIYSTNMMFLGCLITTVASRTTNVIFLSIFVYVFTFMPSSTYFMDQNLFYRQRIIFSFSGNAAIGVFFRKLSYLQNFANSIDWKLLYSSEYSTLNEKDNFISLLMIPSTVVFALLYLYMNVLMVGPFGDKKVWYFLFTKSFWNCACRKKIPQDFELSVLSNGEQSIREILAYTVNLQLENNGKYIVKGFTIELCKGMIFY